LRQKAHGDLLESELHHLLNYDTLTGLPNRTLFHEALGGVLALAPDKGWSVAVLSLDLDHFKDVNDTLGRALGDGVLAQFSERLSGCVSLDDIVGRLGGDEFGLIVAMEEAEQGASTVAGRIRDAVGMPFLVEGREVALTVSIGITVHPADPGDPDTLLKNANTAMYRAKEGGRDTIRSALRTTPGAG
jgi:diguanylate cyclase (GGDEF)-like protein